MEVALLVGLAALGLSLASKPDHEFPDESTKRTPMESFRNP